MASTLSTEMPTLNLTDKESKGVDSITDAEQSAPPLISRRAAITSAAMVMLTVALVSVYALTLQTKLSDTDRFSFWKDYGCQNLGDDGKWHRADEFDGHGNNMFFGFGFGSRAKHFIESHETEEGSDWCASLCLANKECTTFIYRTTTQQTLKNVCTLGKASLCGRLYSGGPYGAIGFLRQPPQLHAKWVTLFVVDKEVERQVTYGTSQPISQSMKKSVDAAAASGHLGISLSTSLERSYAYIQSTSTDRHQPFNQPAPPSMKHSFHPKHGRMVWQMDIDVIPCCQIKHGPEHAIGADATYNDNFTIKTENLAQTPDEHTVPKCIPGHAMRGSDHQECEPDKYLEKVLLIARQISDLELPQ